jgi:glutamate-5-semialdehyde dehydrogenase
MKKRPNGLLIGQKRVPLGVIGIIYEARPNVTADAFALCFKTGNVVILKGGSDAIHSNTAIVASLRKTLKEEQVPEDALLLIEDTSRETTAQFMKMNRYVDVLIPRGGAGLHKLCREQSTIPVITGGIGVCHIYIDDSADIAEALKIIVNAKVQRPSACNSVETLLVNQHIADRFLPALSKQMAESGVTLHADATTLPVLQNGPAIC